MYYLLLAEGFEETEMIAPLDVLRRGGVLVKTVGVTGKTVTGAHGVAIEADCLPEEVLVEEAEGVILPGGMPGTKNLQESQFVQGLIKGCAQKGGLLAAICAAPMVLGEQGLLKGKKAVCFPGFEEYLKGARVEDLPVVTDGNVITAKGAGAALAFGAAILDYAKGGGVGAEILAQMQTPGY